MPLPGDGRTAEQQRRLYSRLVIEDRLVVPAGYRSELLLSWGDRLADGRFGFNNDYLAFTALDATRALLTVNFEYISASSWVAGFSDATGEVLPFEALRQGLAHVARPHLPPQQGRGQEAARPPPRQGQGLG
jgi:hypothetical protein